MRNQHIKSLIDHSGESLVETSFNSLSDRDISILYQRIIECRTFDEIGRINLGRFSGKPISRERIRQIVAKGLRKLRDWISKNSKV
jgi:DNA-directed RNA polymerase sigma subunit (sigma70/sigma32)